MFHTTCILTLSQLLLATIHAANTTFKIIELTNLDLLNFHYILVPVSTLFRTVIILQLTTFIIVISNIIPYYFVFTNLLKTPVLLMFNFNLIVVNM